MGKLPKYGFEGASSFMRCIFLTSAHAKAAHREGDIHIHDLDF